MKRSVRLAPAPGRLVRIPGTGEYLPEAGRKVRLETYWVRRLRDGDVVELGVAAEQRDHTEEG